MNPDCPAAVRLGIGLCRYKLGQFDKARQAFQRVLQASEFHLVKSEVYVRVVFIVILVSHRSHHYLHFVILVRPGEC